MNRVQSHSMIRNAMLNPHDTFNVTLCHFDYHRDINTGKTYNTLAEVFFYLQLWLYHCDFDFGCDLDSGELFIIVYWNAEFKKVNKPSYLIRWKS